MTDPLFTIGIPTFNRASFLRQSLQAALDQSYGNVQILVCDNASTDDTAEIVKELADSRVEYHRSESNKGPQWNFARAVDLAQGQYFSWLQDDDLILSSFVSRAVEVLSGHQAGTYLGTAVYTPTPEFFHRPTLYGPPIRLDWMRGDPLLVDPSTMLGLSYWVSVAIPPVIAFQTELLRTKVKTLRESDFPTFLERTILCEASLAAPVVADPRVCGVFRQHGEQASVELCADAQRYQREWNRMAGFLESISSTQAENDWLQLDECFRGVSVPTLRSWLAESSDWPDQYQAAANVRQRLLAAAKERGVAEQVAKQRKEKLKDFGRQLLPPAFYPLLRKLK